MHGKVTHEGECRRCARCCGYFSLEVDEPENLRDWDDFAWIIAHEGAALHVSGDTWQLVVHNRCRHLSQEGGCLVYDRRPSICKEHEPGECEREQKHIHDYDDLDAVLTTMDELWAYKKELTRRRRSEAAKKAAKKRRKRARKPRKAGLASGGAKS